MTRSKNIRFIGIRILLLALTFTAATVRAQDQSQEPAGQRDTKPKPAARGIYTSYTDEQDNNPPVDQMQPDVTPLTGVQNATLGTTEVRHSYWVPGVQVATNIQSPGFNSWFADTYLIGNLSLLEASSHSSFAVNYSGGAHFSSRLGSGSYQEMALSETFKYRRLTFQLLDDFSYLPQSQFGFGGGTNLGAPGVGGYTGPPIPGLGNNSNQSIFASVGPRYSNAGVVQTTYMVSQRGSVTASGSYAILNFIDPGNVDNNSVSASLGYNYILSRADTVGLVYRFSGYHFPGQPQAFGDHSFNLAYSRKLTGRLALVLSGGPELTEFRIPIKKKTSKLSGDANVNLVYAYKNGGVTIGYFHGVSGGSGVFTGSTADTANLGVNQKLTRVWNGQAYLGYAHNSALSNFTANPTVITLPAYDSWYVGAGVSRPFGRSLVFGASYMADVGTTAKAGCTVGSCTSSQTYNYITLSLQWHSRPLILP